MPNNKNNFSLFLLLKNTIVQIVEWTTFDRAKAFVLVFFFLWSITYSCQSQKDIDNNLLFSFVKGWIDKSNIDSMLKYAKEYEKEAKKQKSKADLAVEKIKLLEQQIKDKAIESKTKISLIEEKYQFVMEEFIGLQNENKVLIKHLEKDNHKTKRVSSEIFARKKFDSLLEKANKSADSLSDEFSNLKDLSDEISSPDWSFLNEIEKEVNIISPPIHDTYKINSEIIDLMRHREILKELAQKNKQNSHYVKIKKEIKLVNSYTKYLKELLSFKRRYNEFPSVDILVPSKFTHQPKNYSRNFPKNNY